MQNLYVYHMESVWHRGMLKAKVVDAISMATGSRRDVAVRAVNKQLVESPMGVASEYRGYTYHRRLLICS
jgi:hypothetical protein